jgi:hypothetical protein
MMIMMNWLCAEARISYGLFSHKIPWFSNGFTFVLSLWCVTVLVPVILRIIYHFMGVVTFYYNMYITYETFKANECSNLTSGDQQCEIGVDI